MKEKKKLVEEKDKLAEEMKRLNELTAKLMKIINDTLEEGLKKIEPKEDVILDGKDMEEIRE